MAPHSNSVAISALVLHFSFSIAHPDFAFISGPCKAGTNSHPASPQWRCRPTRLAVAGSSASEASSTEKKTLAKPPTKAPAKPPTKYSAKALLDEKVLAIQEEDERKTSRWGVSPTKPSATKGNPLKALTSSISAVGNSITATKDALYGVADVAGNLVELTQQQSQQSKDRSELPSSTSSIPGSVMYREAGGASTSKGWSRPDNNKPVFVTAFKVFGVGAVALKDALWGSFEVLGNTADVARSAPEAAKNALGSSKAALEATRDSVEAIVTAPVRAGEAVSGAINGVGKAFTAVKDKAYGVGDAFAGLASVPAALSAKREREQKEREEKAVEEALARREAARKVDAAVTSAKSAVWGTVEGVENLVKTAVSAPAAVESGLGRAQEAVRNAGDLVQSIPRTVQDIPLEAQRKVDGIRESVISTRDSANNFISGVKGGVDATTSLSQRITDEVTGKAKRDREEAERKAKEEARRQKERDAVLFFQGEPYTAGDLTKVGLRAAANTTTVAWELGKGAVWLAGEAVTVPGKVTRTVLGPVYKFQQSRRRIREALANENENPKPTSPETPKSPAGSTLRPLPFPGVQPSEPLPARAPPSSSEAGVATSPVVAATPDQATVTVSPVTGNLEMAASPPSTPVEPKIEEPSEGRDLGDKDANPVVLDGNAKVSNTTRKDFRPAWKKRSRGQ